MQRASVILGALVMYAMIIGPTIMGVVDNVAFTVGIFFVPPIILWIAIELNKESTR